MVLSAKIISKGPTAPLPEITFATVADLRQVSFIAVI